ncbi:MAG TPA: tetratricopeptide repeat protein, partial [Pirellulales bacterium]|nr:tetratricopeptide repeat protein [Pirellulales bacterium]
ARVRVDTDNYADAVSDYGAAIALDANNAALYWERGDARRRYASSGCPADEKPEEFEHAVSDCDKSIEMFPRDPRAYHARAFVWRSQGQYDKAIADHTAAIKLDPTFAAAFSDRAEALGVKALLAGGWKKPEPPEVAALYDRVIDDLNEAIRFDPESPLAFSRRGNFWKEKREYDRAIADYGEAIRLDPFISHYTSRAEVWKAKGDFDKAIADYTEGIRLGKRGSFALERAYEG